MYCPNCAASILRDSLACPRCGASFGPDTAWSPLRNPPESDSPTSSTTRTWWWLLAGAAYGVLMRVIFGVAPSSVHGAMSTGFLVGTPFVIGAIAVYGSPAARASLIRALVVPIIPTALMLLGSAIALLEGSICIALMAPLFFTVATFGGLCMWLTLKLAPIGKRGIGALAILPMLLSPLDRAPLPDTLHELRESIIVDAPPKVVWAQVVTAKDIRPAELPVSITHLIGVPRPVDAVNRMTPSGEVRFSRWERGVHFSAHVVHRQEGSTITWRYSFADDSFPPGTMDEHVVIGGKYLDLGDTTFNLYPLPMGGTRLEVVGRYRLTTPINFYAVPASRFIGRDFLRTLLGFYKGRAERAQAERGDV